MIPARVVTQLNTLVLFFFPPSFPHSPDSPFSITSYPQLQSWFISLP
jgi:hypothetical protein